MRGWAGRWRDAASIAVVTGDTADKVSSTALYFAKMYRDDAARLEIKLLGRPVVGLARLD